MAALEDVYGPATLVEIEPGTRFWATVTVWWPTVLGLVVVDLVVTAVVYRFWIRLRRERGGSTA